MTRIMRLIPPLVALIATSASAQDFSQYSGAQLFARFCASCHGPQGRGDGPVAATLKVEVPDLTRLGRRAGDPFPTEQVRRIVDGRAVPAAHGARRMPVWGYEFATATVGEPDSGAAQAATLVDRLVEHLRTLQRGDAAAPPGGTTPGHSTEKAAGKTADKSQESSK